MTSRKRAAADAAEGSKAASKKSKATPTNAAESSTATSRKGKGKGKETESGKENVKQMTPAERKKRVELSVQKNPAHVYVIGPPGNNWENNAKRVAGYLHFDGRPLEEFRDFLNGKDGSEESQRVAEILKKYVSQRMGNYGRAETSNRGVTPITINVKALWETIDSQAAYITRLFDPDVTLPLVYDDKTLPQGTMPFAIATTIKAMAMLIFDSPTMFPDSHRPENERQHPMGRPQYPAEDWHRAHQLLRFVYRHMTTIKAKTSFLHTDQTEKGYGEEVSFFTAEERDAVGAASQELDVAEGDDEGNVVGSLLHRAQLCAPPEVAEQGQDRVEDVAPEDWDKRMTVFEKSVEEQKQGKSLGEHGLRVRRNRLDTTNMRRLCAALGKEVVIIHDDASGMQTANMVASVTTAAAQEIATSGLNAEEPSAAAAENDFITEMAEAEQAQYWETQRSLSAVSATTKPYEECCQLLGYDVQAPSPYPAGIQQRNAYLASLQRMTEEDQAVRDAGEVPQERVRPPAPRYLLLNPWQVTGQQFLTEQERGPIRGSILCDDCGTGKTIQILCVILGHMRRMQEQHVEGDPANPLYRPTMILAPTSVVDVWFDEINKWFPDLQGWRYFENESKVTEPFMKRRTLPTKDVDLVAWLYEHCPTTDPRSSGTVILSAYETFQFRTLKSFPKVPEAGDTGSLGAATAASSANDQSNRLPSPVENDEDADDNDEEGFATTIDFVRFEYLSRIKGLFYRLVLDEAHKVRNPYTRIAEAIRRLEAPVKHLVTATPMLNRGSDFFSYLTMFWQPRWDIDVGEEGLVDGVPFDVWNPEHIPEHNALYQPGGALDYSRLGLALWRLHPTRFQQAMSSADHLQRCLKAYAVLRQVIPLLMLRRTQATTMIVNDQKIRIGDSIPPYRICTVELDWTTAAEFARYREVYERSIRFLHSGATANGASGSGFRVPTGSRKKLKGNTGTRAFAVHRTLGIFTLNPALLEMLRRSGGRNLASDVEVWYDLAADAGMSLYFDMTKPVSNLPLYADRWSFARYLAKDSPKLKYLAKLMGEICLDEADPRRVLIFTDWPMNQWNCDGFLQNIGFNVKSLRSSQDASDRKLIIDEFNNLGSGLDALLLSIKASSAGLNLHGACSDIIIMCTADNINQVLQALGRAHRIGQKRFQRVWIVTQNHSYDQPMQAFQTKKMLQQIAGEGLIELNEADFRVSQEEIEAATAGAASDIDAAAAVQQLHDRAAIRKGRAIGERSESIIAAMMGQRCSRLTWADNLKDLTAKDLPEEDAATPAKVRTASLTGIPPASPPMPPRDRPDPGPSGTTQQTVDEGIVVARERAAAASADQEQPPRAGAATTKTAAEPAAAPETAVETTTAAKATPAEPSRLDVAREQQNAAATVAAAARREQKARAQQVQQQAAAEKAAQQTAAEEAKQQASEQSRRRAEQRENRRLLDKARRDAKSAQGKPGREGGGEDSESSVSTRPRRSSRHGS